jgi:hypothetical protein
VLDLFVDVVLRILGATTESAWKAARARDRRAEHEAKKPSERVVLVAESQYREWAASHGLTREERQHAWTGRLMGCTVVVRPGLAGSSPTYVVAELEIAHDQTEPVLITQSSPRTDPLVRAMREVFDDDDLEGKLRTIAIVPHGVTLRFMPLTPPRVVERAIEDVVRELSPRAAPYR